MGFYYGSVLLTFKHFVIDASVLPFFYSLWEKSLLASNHLKKFFV